VCIVIIVVLQLVKFSRVKAREVEIEVNVRDLEIEDRAIDNIKRAIIKAKVKPAKVVNNAIKFKVKLAEVANNAIKFKVKPAKVANNTIIVKYARRDIEKYVKTLVFIIVVKVLVIIKRVVIITVSTRQLIMLY
jgi:hypothetical protein